MQLCSNLKILWHCLSLGLEWKLPGSYATLLSTASDLVSTTSHIHNWMLFLLCLHLFTLSGVSSPLISSSILGTFDMGEFIFQCPIFLPFHTVHGFLKARMLKWFAIPFSSGPHFVRTLHHDPSSLNILRFYCFSLRSRIREYIFITSIQHHSGVLNFAIR